MRVPQIELLKLQRQVNDTRREMTSSELKVPVIQSAIQESMLNRIGAAQSFVRATRKAQQTQDKLCTYRIQCWPEDRVNQTVVISPVIGTVETLNVNTVGGVIQPGMDIWELCPVKTHY